MPHVIDSDPNDEWDWEEMLSNEKSWRELLVAVYNDEPIGFVQILDPEKEETNYWGEMSSGYRAIDIWIGPEDKLGQGHGTAIMGMVVDSIFLDNSVNSILVDPLKSNVRAKKFYERIGFHFIEDRVFGDDICSVMELQRSDWDFDSELDLPSRNLQARALATPEE